MNTLGEMLARDAWAAFDAWCKEHDPDGEMTPEQQVNAYSQWCALKTIADEAQKHDMP